MHFSPLDGAKELVNPSARFPSTFARRIFIHSERRVGLMQNRLWEVVLAYRPADAHAVAPATLPAFPAPLPSFA
jgi:hypothetical protein